MSTNQVYAKALYDYDDASNGNVLRMKEGEMILITEIRQDGWWAGKIGDRVGYFPSNYAEMVNNEGVATSADASIEVTTFNRNSREGSAASFIHQRSIPSPTSTSNLTWKPAPWASDRSSTVTPRKTPPELPLAGTTKIAPAAGAEKYSNSKAFSPPYETRKEENTNDKETGEEETTTVTAAVVTVNDVDSKGKESWWTKDRRARYACLPCRKRGFVLSKAQYYSLNCFFCGLVFMTIILIVLYAIVPIVVKNAVGGSQIQFNSITITNPQGTTMDVVALGQITGAGPISAKLGDMNMYISEINPDGTSTLFGSIILPAMTVQGDTQLSTKTKMNILDMNAFNSFTKHMIFNNQIRWHLEASASVTPVLGGISGPTYSNIPFSKDVTMPACGGLTNATLNQFQLTGGDAATGAAAQINIVLVNPSIFNIMPLGDLHFEMFVNGAKLGDVHGLNQNMLVGVNNMAMTAFINSPNQTFVSDVFNRYLNKINTVITAVASPIDASSIPLYKVGMAGLTLNTVLVPPTAPTNFVNFIAVTALGQSETCMNNPFPAAMQIHVMTNGAVTFNGNLLANIINQQVNFTLNGNAHNMASPPIQSQNLNIGTGLALIFSQLLNQPGTVLDLTITVDLLVGGPNGFPVEINIQQKAIPAMVQLTVSAASCALAPT